MRELALSNQDGARLFDWFAWAAALSAPLVGVFLDRVGIKWASGCAFALSGTTQALEGHGQERRYAANTADTCGCMLWSRNTGIR